MVTIGFGGLVASAALAEADPWSLDTLSHLGADPGAGLVFRLAMMLVGACGIVLAGLVSPLLGRLRERGLVGRRWGRLHALAFWVIGLGFVGVGVFPLGISPALEIAHGVSAYAPAIAVLVLMLTATLAVPAFGAGFGRASLAVLAGELFLYLLAVGGLISYALMEALAFGLGGAWFVAFVVGLVRLDAAPDGLVDRRAREVPAAR
jgi:hypothetical protein